MHDVPSDYSRRLSACSTGRWLRIPLLASALVFAATFLVPATVRAQTSSVEDDIATFISDVYLKSGYPSDIDPLDLLTDWVDYWGKGNLSRRHVVRLKDRYYRRWPVRNYTLIRESLEVFQKPSVPDTYYVSFRYVFDVSGRKGTRRGEATTRLVLVAGGRYGFLIREENGEVNKRF